MVFRVCILIFFLISVPSWAQKSEANDVDNYKAVTLVDFDNVIWSFSFINENEVLISLRKGELYYFNIKTKEKIKLKIPKIEEYGQGGLLDVHYVNSDETHYIYYTFSENYNGLMTTSLARGIYQNKTVSEIETLFSAKTDSDKKRHFGSRLLFKDNTIFMTIGDRGKRDYAQDLGFHNGKILRLTMEGKPAPGNPFENTQGALPEIWSLGHRNPQGIDLDPVTGEIYSIEFGPRGGDELNIIKKSANYGWPIITYGKEYWGPSIGTTHKKGMEQPVTYWTPSISPSGMAFYHSDKLPLWNNSLFLAALGSQHLRRLTLNKGKVTSEEILFAENKERVRHVRTSPDGWLYYSTDSGKLIRIQN